MNKRFILWLVLGLLVVSIAGLNAAGPAPGDILVELRLYQGFHENGKSPHVTANSYYLQKTGDDNLLPDAGKEKIEQNLIKVYNLKKIQELSTMSVALKGDNVDHQSHLVELNGRKLWLGIGTNPEKKDRFAIRISEENKPKAALLESEIIVPLGKTAVLGFKDSLEQVFFLAFNRETQWKFPQLKDKTFVEHPRLLSGPEPIYPKEAIEKGITGEVVVTGQTDLDGNIGDVKILEGPSLLNEVVKKTLAQWKYAIWKIDEVKKPLEFTFIFVFRMEEPSGKEIQEILDRCRPLFKRPQGPPEVPRILEILTVNAKKMKEKKQTLAEQLNAKSVQPPMLIRRVEPKYPASALSQKVQGEVILKCTTDPEGKVIKAEIIKGNKLLAAGSSEIAGLWKYTPWIIDGTPKPVEFFLVFIFNLENVPPDKINSLVDGVLKNNNAIMDKAKQHKLNPSLPFLMEVIIIEGKKE